MVKGRSKEDEELLGVPDLRVDLNDPIYDEGPIERPQPVDVFVRELVAEVRALVQSGAVDEWTAQVVDQRCSAFRGQWDVYSERLHAERLGLAHARMLAIDQKIVHIQEDLKSAKKQLDERTKG